MAARTPPKRVLAIDWDSQTLRLVHAFLTKRGVTIDRMLAVPLPADVDSSNPELMGRHIRRVLDQESITTKHAIVDIPRDQAILKTLTLPNADPEELAGIVEIQIAKELPFPVSDAVIDFAAGPPDAESKTVDVLVAAVRKEVREQYEGVFASAGLKLDRIGLRPYANKVAICKLLQFGMPDRVVFVDVRPALTEIDILRHGSLTFSRAASVVIPRDLAPTTRLSLMSERDSHVDESGGGAILSLVDGGGLSPLRTPESGPLRTANPADAVIAALVVELTRSIEAYRATDPGAVMDHVVIGGDTGIEEALAETVQKRLSVTTELYNPASTFGWQPDEGASASSFASTLGLVLGHAEAGVLHFDYLHPKRRGQAKQERLRKAPAAAAAVVLLLFAPVILATQYRKADRRALAAINDQITDLEKSRDDWAKLEKFARDQKTFDAGQHVWVDVMYDMFSQLPGNDRLVVNHLDMNQEKSTLLLKTKAKTRDEAIELVRKLNEFRREGREVPRFKVTMGPQSEKKGEEYAFVQDLRAILLNDEVKPKKVTAGAPSDNP